GILRVRGQGDSAPELLVRGGSAWSLLIDGNDLFFSDSQSGTIERAPRDGGVPVVIVGEPGYYGRLAVDGDRLYWAKQFPMRAKSDSIFVSKTDGSGVKLIADHQNPIIRILPHDTKVYWLTRGSTKGLFEDGELLVADPGQQPRPLLASLSSP